MTESAIITALIAGLYPDDHTDWKWWKWPGPYLREAKLPGGLRPDLAMTRHNETELLLVEAKANLATWRADEKWREYLPFCSHFILIAPEEVAEEMLEVAPEWVGVTAVKEEDDQVVVSEVKRVFRKNPAAEQARITAALASICRLGWQRSIKGDRCPVS